MKVSGGCGRDSSRGILGVTWQGTALPGLVDGSGGRGTPMWCVPDTIVITMVCALLLLKTNLPHTQNNLISLKLNFECISVELS